nr:hypothetical protein [Bacteriovoracaceae bacterium]
MDIVMSLGICFYLVSMAIDIVRMNLPDLLDASPHFTEKLYAQVKKFPRVLDCHKMRIRGNTSSMYIDFHILVEDKLSLKEAHNIAHELEDHIRLLLKDEVTELDITAHVEPYEENHHD